MTNDEIKHYSRHLGLYEYESLHYKCTLILLCSPLRLLNKYDLSVAITYDIMFWHLATLMLAVLIRKKLLIRSLKRSQE
jgi:hypothetical protein